MENKRTIIVGDVHGCLTELHDLLAKVSFNREHDRLIVAGDLVDRGPDSVGVVRFVRENGECVLGNHEAKLMRRWRHHQRKLREPKYKIPMRPSEDQEATLAALSMDDARWLSGLPSTITLEEQNIVIVHAGVIPSQPIERQPEEVHTMVRFISEKNHRMQPLIMPGFRQPNGSVFWAEVYDGEKDIIFGHNVVGLEQPRTWAGNESRGWCHGIDTGCVFGGHLTAVILPALPPGTIRASGTPLEIVQVKARKAYHEYNAGGE